MNGKDSPTSLSAVEALEVKMTVEPGGALKKERTEERAWEVREEERRELLGRRTEVSKFCHLERMDHRNKSDKRVREE